MHSTVMILLASSFSFFATSAAKREFGEGYFKILLGHYKPCLVTAKNLRQAEVEALAVHAKDTNFFLSSREIGPPMADSSLACRRVLTIARLKTGLISEIHDMEEERAIGEESVFVYLLDNGELAGLLDDTERLTSGLKYELVLAERRLVEDRSVAYFSHLMCPGQGVTQSSRIWIDQESQKTFRPSGTAKLWERPNPCSHAFTASSGKMAGETFMETENSSEIDRRIRGLLEQNSGLPSSAKKEMNAKPAIAGKSADDSRGKRSAMSSSSFPYFDEFCFTVKERSRYSPPSGQLFRPFEPTVWNFLILTNLVVVLVVVPLLNFASPFTPEKSVERLGRTMLCVLGMSFRQNVDKRVFVQGSFNLFLSHWMLFTTLFVHSYFSYLRLQFSNKDFKDQFQPAELGRVLKSKTFYIPSDLTVATHLPEIIRSMKQERHGENGKRPKRGRKEPDQVTFEADNGGLLFPPSVIDNLASDKGAAVFSTCQLAYASARYALTKHHKRPSLEVIRAPIMSRPPPPTYLLPQRGGGGLSSPMSARSLDEAVSRLFEAGISSQKVASDVLGVGVGDMHHRSPGIKRRGAGSIMGPLRASHFLWIMTGLAVALSICSFSFAGEILADNATGGRTPIEDFDAEEEEDGMAGEKGDKGIYKKYVAALGRGISAWANRA